jgi:hypothetical protein
VKTDKIFIDVGTHKAQELRVLSGDQNFIVNEYFQWWASLITRFIKNPFRKKPIRYGEGRYTKSPLHFSLKDHLKILSTSLIGNKHIESYKIISIDPAFEVSSKYIKRINEKLLFFPVSLSGEDNSLSIIPLYLSNNSLSSSVFKDEDKFSKHSYCLNLSPSQFFQSLLNLNIISNENEIILRMNCEGAETDIIKALQKHNFNVKIILGSLGDVKKVHGNDRYQNLLKNLDSNNIVYQYFKGTDPSTWLESFKLLKKNEL